MTDRTFAVFLGEQLYVVDDYPGAQQCTARTVRRKRCKNYVQSDQITGWVPVLVPGWGELSAYDLGGRFGDAGRWLAQRCEVHWPAEPGDDFAAPEWVLFDPDVHTALKGRGRAVRWLVWRGREGVRLEEHPDRLAPSVAVESP